MNLRLPNITASDQAGQIAQVKSYLMQLVQELNYEVGQAQDTAKETQDIIQNSSAMKNTPVDTFNDIKALIIKSADIVTAYQEKMTEKFSGMYVAQSDYGDFVEATNNAIERSDTGIKQAMDNLQNIDDTMIRVKAHVNTGLLFYDDSGAPVYGVEVGQRTEVNGAEVFNKYARFTSSKLSFYDANGNEVAYISNNKLYILDAEVTGSFKMGHFKESVMGDKSIVRRYVGG